MFHHLAGPVIDSFIRCHHVLVGAVTWVIMVSRLTELGDEVLVSWLVWYRWYMICEVSTCASWSSDGNYYGVDFH